MTNEKAIKHLEVIKGDCALVGDIRAIDMAISALSAKPELEKVMDEIHANEGKEVVIVSAEGEYIKKEDAYNCFLKWRPYMAARMDKYEKEMLELPTVSFPDREKGEQLYSDLLRVKHGTMNIDSLIDKEYREMMRGKAE